MNEIRFATLDDLEIIKDFIKENPYDVRKEIGSSYEDKIVMFENILNPELNSDNNFLSRVVICKHNNKIIAMIMISLFKFINSYYMHGLKIGFEYKKSYYKLKGTIIEDLYNFVIDYAESLGYYSYYATADESTEKRKTKIAYDQLEKLKRYEIYLVGYIDKNEIPFLSVFKKFQYSMNRKILIRYFVLKNDFRKPVNLAIPILDIINKK